MPTKFILKNKTTTELNSIIGTSGEIVIDSSKNTIVVMDGSNAGGTPMALESFVKEYDLPSKTGANGKFLSVNQNAKQWKDIDVSLLSIGTIIESFKDLPEEYFIKFDGTLKRFQDYPEFSEIYNNTINIAVPQIQNSPSNYYNRDMVAEYSVAETSLYTYDVFKSNENMVYDGSHYVRILGQIDETGFKVQKTVNGIDWITTTVPAFSNNATRCYSILSDKNGNIFMVAQAIVGNAYPKVLNDVVVMSSDHGDTWTEVSDILRNTGRVLAYNSVGNKLYLISGKILSQFGIIVSSNPHPVSIANYANDTVNFVENVDASCYLDTSTIPNYITTKNDLMMYISADHSDSLQTGEYDSDYNELEFNVNCVVGQQTSLLTEEVTHATTNSTITSWFNGETINKDFRQEVAFCKVPATYRTNGTIQTPDHIYALSKYKGNTYRMYIQNDEEPYKNAFTLYAEFQLDFDPYTEILVEEEYGKSIQRGVVKFHWSPILGFMILTKNKIFYNLDPINNKTWNKISGLNETRNYRFVTCINTNDGILISGMTDVIYVRTPTEYFLLPNSDTVLPNKLKLSKYIKIR